MVGIITIMERLGGSVREGHVTLILIAPAGIITAQAYNSSPSHPTNLYPFTSVKDRIVDYEYIELICGKILSYI
jgi:hypothetical protein